MSAVRSKAGFARLSALLLLTQFSGCASPVPGGNGSSALSGKSLQVTLRYNGQVNRNFYYFFLINNSNSSSAPGPIPVGAPILNTTYGNGFATGSDSRSGGFTDFVLFSVYQFAGAQRAGDFALYHVADGAVTNANSSTNFIPNGAPVQSTVNGNTIGFQIDLAQLFSYPGSPNNQLAAVTKAINLQFIQVNAVSTDVLPNANESITKQYDSFGDDSSNLVGSFQLMDLLVGGGTYANGDNTLSAATTEPNFNDVVISPQGSVGGDPSLDLVYWQILVNTANASRAAK